ncbi:MAG TPA: bifunctional DedA family/phosphatase PAP2 family protein [Candidatus Competibacteraceae bacterium]|nr:bifunctional DedA family/phosphatase PAP2 family protein [Candidatus Competibacteraceae bacterium]
MLHEPITALLAWIAAHPGWMGLVILLTALGESLAMIGMLVPGALLMFGFGALIALGHVEFWNAWAWAAVGATLGDGLSFWLGRHFHQQLRNLWPFSRYPQTLTRAEDFFRRHGGKSILFGRFIGPVRAVVPAVAGMLDMPLARYIPANLLASVLWAPAYLLPGMVFAASLELAAQVAWRLVVLILLLLALIGLTVWLVRLTYRLFAPRLQFWLAGLFRWGAPRPWLGPVLRSLLDPHSGEVRGLTTVAVVLLGGSVLLALTLAAAGQTLPTSLDRSLYQFLQELRTPWADRVMVLITQLGDWPPKTLLTAAVFAWLWRQGARSAAWHWLAAVGFGVLSNTSFKWLFAIQRPQELYVGVSSFSFPSNHATLTTLLFGFLAVLIARETPWARRWLVYLGAALVILPVAFSRLSLGAHWLTDTVAGICLGLVWVGLVGLAYNRHLAPPLDRRGLLRVSLITLLLTQVIYGALRFDADLQRYRPQSAPQMMAAADWWQDGWRRLPGYRQDFLGQPRQRLPLQWAAPRAALLARLQGAGWRPANGPGHGAALQWLNPAVTLEQLPVLPQVHAGQHDAVTLVRPAAVPEERWVLRFWDSGWRLDDGTPLWLGGLSRERLERRLDFFSLAREEPGLYPPQPLLAAALDGLEVRTAALPEQADGVILIRMPRP